MPADHRSGTCSSSCSCCVRLKSASSIATLYRRCPPGVRKGASSPRRSILRSVVKLMPRYSAASLADSTLRSLALNDRSSQQLRTCRRCGELHGSSPVCGGLVRSARSAVFSAGYGRFQSVAMHLALFSLSEPGNRRRVCKLVERQETCAASGGAAWFADLAARVLRGQPSAFSTGNWISVTYCSGGTSCPGPVR